jgi:hypothetical protein
MEKIENEKNGLIQSQKSLYTKLKRINKLFKIHFSSLTSLFLFAIAFIILWTYLLIAGQITMEISQQYGLFGTIVTIFLTTVLFLLIIVIGIQISRYSLFIIRGNRSLKQVKDKEGTRNALYNGIVPYITNLYTFFNFFDRYSKEKTNLGKSARTFLFLNFFSGFNVVLLFTQLLDVGNTSVLINVCIGILFLSLLFFCLINLMTSFKIRNEIVKWEKLFPKLEKWAQELGQFSLENSTFFDEEETP